MSAQETMMAIEVAEDEAHSLQWRPVARPQPGPGEVLIEVRAAAINRADLLQRRGLYPVPEGESTILGLECAGEIVELGQGVDATWLGKRVASLLGGGGYAEYATTSASMLLELPEAMSFVEAASIPEVFYTAYLNLVDEGGLRAGELCLIHAGASGVGTAAIQIAQRLGAQAWATASGGKLEALRELGARACFDRKQEGMFERVRERLGDGRGVDVILDPVAASYLAGNQRVLALEGRLVIIGLLGGLRAQLDLARLLRMRQRIVGSTLRSRSRSFKSALSERFRAQIWEGFGDGSVQTIIDRVLPIAQVEQAHAAMLANETTGKVVLRVG